MAALSGFEGYPGPEWQDLCLRVLHEHHPGPELVEVPDDDSGDAGLEAFSLSGHAYQCYSPKGEPLALPVRFERQRDKITDDVAKFRANSEKIEKLIPPNFKFMKWILLVPFINTKRIVEHCATKSRELQSANLPYASDDIMVTALTLSAFERAREAVIRRQLIKLELPPIPSTDFSHIDDGLIGRMHKKLSMTTRYTDDDVRTSFINRFLGSFIAGRAHRDHIGDHYSELGDQLERQLGDLEARLDVHYALQETVPDRRLVTVLMDTEKTVQDVLNTHGSDSRVIAEGQVADWLMRCPLDFV